MKAYFLTTDTGHNLLIVPDTQQQAEELQRWQDTVVAAQFDSQPHPDYPFGALELNHLQ